jgi:dihydrofolate reductase
VSEAAPAGTRNEIALVLVAAVGENGVIGAGNRMPWRLRSEQLHFRALTMGKPIVMGRKTHLSLRRPLDGRTNIVVSRDPMFAAPGVVVARDLDTALAVARGDALRRGVDAIMIIGGAEIYEQAMPVADRIELTLVHLRPEGETHFPPIDRDAWVEIERGEQAAGPGDDGAFTYVSLRRKSTAAAAEGHAPRTRVVA